MDFRKSQDNLRLMINSVEKNPWNFCTEKHRVLHMETVDSFLASCLCCQTWLCLKIVRRVPEISWVLSADLMPRSPQSYRMEFGAVFGALLIVWNLQEFTAMGQEELWLNDCHSQSWCAVCRNSRAVLCTRCIIRYMHVSNTFCFKSTSHMSL